MSLSLYTQPTASQMPDIMERVLAMAEQIPAAEPVGVSILPIFMPAYNKAKEEVEKLARPLAQAEHACKFTYSFLYKGHPLITFLKGITMLKQTADGNFITQLDFENPKHSLASIQDIWTSEFNAVK